MPTSLLNVNYVLNYQHPEKENNEYFLFNSFTENNIDAYIKNFFNTLEDIKARFGQKAYTKEGKRFFGARPIFINCEDFHRIILKNQL